VRLRHEVLPLLEDVLQGGVTEALARTGSLLRDDLAALDELAADHLARVVRTEPGDEPGTGGRLEVAAVASLPRALRTRVLRLWAEAPGAAPLSAERTAALDALITNWRGQGPIDLPGRLAVARTSGRLVLYHRPPVPQE
jgi:tRNA(Ile)-lysidine synthase